MKTEHSYTGIYYPMAKRTLKNLIERCHKRHTSPLQQRHTSISAAVYNVGIPYDYTVYFAHQQSVTLNALEEANISFMPIGRAPGNDRGPRTLDKDWTNRFSKQQLVSSWGPRSRSESWGIQIYTGIPSERYGARWHDVDFNYESIYIASEAILRCIEALIKVSANPLITLTKSGGLRFSCRIPEYLHPNIEDDDSHTIDIPPYLQSVYPRILGDKAYSRWDARYEILIGEILDPPIISRDSFLTPVNNLRDELNEMQISEKKLKGVGSNKERTTYLPYDYPFTLGSRRIDLAREALKKRGFSYVRKNNDFHQWTLFPEKASNQQVLLWEREGIVWIRASTPNYGLPIEATPITDVWDDTGIIPTTPSRDLMLTDQFLKVQQRESSPLSLKRTSPILKKDIHQSDGHQIDPADDTHFQSLVDGDARILVLVTNDSVLENSEITSHVTELNPLTVNIASTTVAEDVEGRFHNIGSRSVKRWKHRMHNWDQVKNIPIEKCIQNPFEQGNVCIDAARCNALEEKGGDARVSICPKCPVNVECQESGYLSQYTSFTQSDIQILNNTQIFFNPIYEDVCNEILTPVDETERLCFVHTSKIHDLFTRCEVSLDTLRDWIQYWRGEPLGNFASYLLNDLVLKGRFNDESVKRIRSTLLAFQKLGDIITKQMCGVNVSCKISESGYIHPDTGQKLANHTIEFENGVKAFIPLDNDGIEVLQQMNLPYFIPESYVVNEKINLIMPMEKAIELGILNIDTVENIENLPTVNPNSNWTLWHQLSCFFEHYKRDEDARVRWDKSKLEFWIPPKLHPRINRLMLEIPMYTKQHLKRVFPDDVIEDIHIKPKTIKTGNRLFQIRTGIYPRESILSSQDVWDVYGINELGQRFFVRILEEIKKNPSESHTVVSFDACMRQLKWIIQRENVSFFKHSEDYAGFQDTLENADVIWIVGAPEPPQGLIWRQAQILFGNDDIPLQYTKDRDTGLYSDNRMQQIYKMNIVNLLKSTLKCIGLDQQSGKTVVLLSALGIQGITDMPNTLLFDWEDFEVAGSLEKLPDVIANRQSFETDREELTSKSSRQEVEWVLGCSSRQANRVLQKLRGGAPLRIPFRLQILSLLAEGNKKTSELLNAIEGNPEAVKNELKRLIDRGEIKRVQRGIYSST